MYCSLFYIFDFSDKSIKVSRPALARPLQNLFFGFIFVFSLICLVRRMRVSRSAAQLSPDVSRIICFCGFCFFITLFGFLSGIVQVNTRALTRLRQHSLFAFCVGRAGIWAPEENFNDD